MQKLITALTSLKPKLIEIEKFIERIPEFWHTVQKDIAEELFTIEFLNIYHIFIVNQPNRFQYSQRHMSEKSLNAFWVNTTDAIKKEGSSLKSFKIQNNIKDFPAKFFINGFEITNACIFSLKSDENKISHQYIQAVLRNNGIKIYANILTAQLALQKFLKEYYGSPNVSEVIVPFVIDGLGKNFGATLKIENDNVTLILDELSLETIIRPQTQIIILGNY